MKLYHIYIETPKKDLLCLNKQGNTPELAEQSAYIELQRTQSIKGYRTVAIIPETINKRPNVMWFEKKMA